MESSGETTRLLGQLQSENPELRGDAERKIFQKYFEKIVRLATSKLRPKILQRIGADDVALSVLKSFLLRQERGEFVLDSSDDLEKLLTRMTINKVASAARRHGALKQDVNRDVSLSAGGSSGEDRPRWVFEHMELMDPSAEEATFIQEAIELLPDEELQTVVLWTLAGNQQQEIADHLGYKSTETIRLKKRRIYGIWQEHGLLDSHE